MRGLKPRRAAIAELNATEQPQRPRILSSCGSIQRQWAQTNRSFKKPTSSRYSVGKRFRTCRTAATSPQIWLRWMVANGIQALLQPAQLLQQIGRAHVWRPSGDADPDAISERPMPLGVQVGDPAHRALAKRPVDLEAALIANAALRLVPGALAKKQPQPGLGDRISIEVDIRAVLQHRRRAAADRLERREPAHDAHLV